MRSRALREHSVQPREEGILSCSSKISYFKELKTKQPLSRSVVKQHQRYSIGWPLREVPRRRGLSVLPLLSEPTGIYVLHNILHNVKIVTIGK